MSIKLILILISTSLINSLTNSRDVDMLKTIQSCYSISLSTNFYAALQVCEK